MALEMSVPIFDVGCADSNTSAADVELPVVVTTRV